MDTDRFLEELVGTKEKYMRLVVIFPSIRLAHRLPAAMVSIACVTLTRQCQRMLAGVACRL